MKHGIKHDRSQGLIDFAFRFAKEAHGDQKRKYTNDPYIVHPVAVANMVASVTDDCEIISAAFLHDVIEDTTYTYDDIKYHFGFSIAELVNEVTDVSRPEDGNRAKRKEIDRLHLEKASPQGKTIKLADLIDNSHYIVSRDPGFAKTYMKEKQELLKVLTEGNTELYIKAETIVSNYFNDPPNAA